MKIKNVLINNKFCCRCYILLILSEFNLFCVFQKKQNRITLVHKMVRRNINLIKNVRNRLNRVNFRPCFQKRSRESCFIFCGSIQYSLVAMSLKIEKSRVQFSREFKTLFWHSYFLITRRLAPVICKKLSEESQK